MKKKIAIALALSLVLGTTGCGEKKQDTTTGAVEETTKDTEEEVVQNVEETPVQPEDEPSTQEATEESTTEETKSSPTVTFETKTEERTLEDGSVIIEVSCMTPTVTIPGNEQAQDLIAQSLGEMEESFYAAAAESENDARAFYTENPTALQDAGHFLAQLDYDISRVDDKVVSLIRNDVTYTGGAHGYGGQSGVNYDTKTGEILTIDKITDDKEAFVACVKDYIINECDNGEYKEAVFPDYKDYLDYVVADDCWRFDDTGIVFIANAYTLGPYAAGTMIFTIPYDQVEGLSADYKK